MVGCTVVVGACRVAARVLGLHEARDIDQEVDVGDVEGLQMCKMYETAMDLGVLSRTERSCVF
jgi:hypothetical protein